MRVHLANKILSGFSAILSTLLGITSAWTLASLLIRKYGNGSEQEQKSCNSLSLCSSNSHSEFEDEHGGHEAVIIESSDLSPRSFRMWTEFYDMNSSFHLIVMICLSCAIAASLVQFGCSLAIILSPPFKIAKRSRRSLVFLFVAFVTFLACFSWPIGYRREYDDDDPYPYHSISTLNSSVNNFIMNFEINQLFKDLTLYYFEIFANIIFLFFYMVTTCCLLRCNEDWQYDV